MRHNLVLILLSTVLLGSCNQKTTQSEKALRTNHRIIDKAEVLTTAQKDSLFMLVLDLEQNVGPQMAVMTIDTLNGESIEDFSLHAAEQLKLGREQFNDGILIVASIKDRKIRIEVGYGLEPIIKDEIASRINREKIVPFFKNGRYYDGFSEAVIEMKKLIEDNKSLIVKSTAH